MICPLKNPSGLEGCHLQMMLPTEIAPTGPESLWIWKISSKMQLQNGENEFINAGLELQLHFLPP